MAIFFRPGIRLFDPLGLGFAGKKIETPKPRGLGLNPIKVSSTTAPAPAAPAVAAAAAPEAPRDMRAYARDRLVTKHGYEPHQAAAIAGAGWAESKFDTTASGDDGSAFGAFQWRGERLQQLRAFAKEQGADPSNIDVQLDFVAHEMDTSEAFAGQKLRAAKDATSAAEAMMHFERPAGYSRDNPRGGHQWKERVGYANEILALDGTASPPPTAPVAADAAPERQPGLGGNPDGKGLARLAPAEKAPDAPAPGTLLSFAHPDQTNIDPAFRGVLETTAEQIGSPLRVTSGYRSPEHNRKIKGAKQSMHMTGQAVDIDMGGMDPQQRIELIKTLRANGANRFIAYSSFPDMLHVDSRDQTGTGAPWFMFNKTASLMPRAPAWYKQAAQETAAIKPGQAFPKAPRRPGEKIVVTDGFETKDPMRLFGETGGLAETAGKVGVLPARAPAPEPRPADAPAGPGPEAPAGAPVSSTDGDFAVLEAQEPGRYKMLPAAEYETWKEEWDRANKSSGFMGDTWRLLKSGANSATLSARESIRQGLNYMDPATRVANAAGASIPGAGDVIVGAIDKIDEWSTGRTSDQIMRGNMDAARTTLTPEMGAATQKDWITETKNPDGSTSWRLGPAWKDPRAYYGTAVESIPGTALTMVPAARLGKAAETLTLARGGSQVAASAARAKVATVAGSAFEGLQGGGDAAIAVRQKIRELPRNVLESSVAVQELVKSGLTFDQAVEAIATDAGTQAFLVGGALTAVFGGQGDRVLAQILADGVGGNLAKRVARGAAREAISEGLFEEAPQSAGQKIVENIGVQKVDPTKGTFEGVANETVGGAIGGGLMGGGMGAGAGAASPANPDHVAPGAPAAPQTDTPAVVMDPADPARGITEPGRLDGARVTITADQGGVPNGMRRVRLPDGSVTFIGEGLLSPQPKGPIGKSLDAAETKKAAQAPPLSPPQEAAAGAAAASGGFQPGQEIEIDAGDMTPVRATIDSIDATTGELLVFDKTTGEWLQVPVEAAKAISPAPQPAAPTTGEESANAAAARGRPSDFAPGLTNPAAQATTAAPEPPLAAPDATAAPIEAPSDQAAPIAGPETAPAETAAAAPPPSDAGTQTAPADAPAAPSDRKSLSERAKSAPEGSASSGGGEIDIPGRRMIAGTQAIFPDEDHAFLYSLGEKLRIGQNSQMPMARVAKLLEADRADAAARFGVSIERINEIADDYRYRAQRAAKTAKGASAIEVPPINAARLAGWRAEAAAAAEAAPAAQAAPAEPTPSTEAEIEAAGAAAYAAGKGRSAPAQIAQDTGAAGAAAYQAGWDRAAAAAAPAKAGPPLAGAPAKAGPETAPAPVDTGPDAAPPPDAPGPVAAAAPASASAPASAAAIVSPVDAAAHTAATSPTNDLPEPTQAQKEAGNYKKGPVTLGGLNLSIENPAGSTRSGKSRTGKAWSITMKAHYGYIKGTVGKDKDHIDVFVRPGTVEIDDESPVTVIDQTDPDTGKFDEHKIMLGYPDEETAYRAYKANYTRGWKGGEKRTLITLGDLKSWLADGDTKRPIAEDLDVGQEQGPNRPNYAGGDTPTTYDAAKDKLPYGQTVNDLVFPKPVEKVFAAKGEPQIPQEEANRRIALWKRVAKRIGETRDRSKKVIISLFDDSGSWSQPFRDAGYDVLQYDLAHGHDIFENFPIADIEEIAASDKQVDGVLSACPCTTFANSGTRWWEDRHDRPDPDMVRKLFGPYAARSFDTPVEANTWMVHMTGAVVDLTAPRFHTLENPMGRIARMSGLPKPALVFDPANYGDPYTKETQLFGRFNTELPTANVYPVEGSKIQSKLRGDNAEDKRARSLTPEGFAYAFFMAQDPDAKAILAEIEAEDAAAQAPTTIPGTPYEIDGVRLPAMPAGVQIASIHKLTRAEAKKSPYPEGTWRANITVDGHWNNHYGHSKLSPQHAVIYAVEDTIHYLKRAGTVEDAPALAALVAMTDEFKAAEAAAAAAQAPAPAPETSAPSPAPDVPKGVKVPELPEGIRLRAVQQLGAAAARGTPYSPTTWRAVIHIESIQRDQAGFSGISPEDAIDEAIYRTTDYLRKALPDSAALPALDALVAAQWSVTNAIAARPTPASPVPSPETVEPAQDAAPAAVRPDVDTADPAPRLGSAEGDRTEGAGERPVGQQAPFPPGAIAPVVDRAAGAYAHGVSLIMEASGLPEPDARHVVDYYLRRKLAKLDVAISRFQVKSGNLLNPEEIATALAAEKAEKSKPEDPPAAIPATNIPENIPAAAEPPRFTGNTIFTADKVAAARARLRSKLSTLNAGIDPEVAIDGMVIAGAYIEEGVRDFAVYAKRMIEDFGDAVRPYILSFWEGARAWPGLDTANMTDAATSAQMFADLMKPGIPVSEQPAVGITVPAPKKRAPRGGGDLHLTDDWGVSSIDGWDAKDERPFGPTKDAFLKEAMRYLRAVAAYYEDRGYIGVTNRRGKVAPAVSRNDGGSAVSGDATLHIENPETGTKIYASIAGSNLRGVVPTTKSGVSIMFRIGERNYADDGTNQWAPINLTADEFSAMIAKAIERFEARNGRKAETAPVQVTDDGSRTLEGSGAGTLAGISPDQVQSVAGSGDARSSADDGGGTDLFGDRGAGSPGILSVGSGGNGVSVLPAAASGGRPSAGEGGTEPGARDLPGNAGNPKRPPRRKRPVEPDLLSIAATTAATPAQNIADDYTITDADRLGEGGQKAKFAGNVEAIRILRRLDEEQRLANAEEQTALAKWVGWGGMPQAFYRPDGTVAKGWEREAATLKDLLTVDEYKAAEASTLNAHYTAPSVVKAMWRAAERMGFTGGRVLEPAMGSGNFLGLMPGAMRRASAITGVELDHITGAIAKNLYQAARIYAPAGFETIHIPDGFYDFAIGNPPFGPERLNDPQRRHLAKMSIHNYFIAKSLETVKPGGGVIMVVSNYFLDARKNAARQAIATTADLVAAIRLPNDAFLKNANTEVTTDIVVFRKRKDGEDPVASLDWALAPVQTYYDKNGTGVPLNPYFIANPDQMLGEFGAFGSMYRADSAALVSRPGDDLAALLDAAVQRLPANILEPIGSDVADPRDTTVAVPRSAKDAAIGSFFVDEKGTLWRRGGDMMGEPTASMVDTGSARATERIVDMVRMRDAFARLRRAQLSDTASDAAIEEIRATLNDVYDRFVKKNGPINLDVNKRLFREDPTWPQVAALEVGFDKGISTAVAANTGETPRPPSARKAEIFTKRTQRPYRRPTTAATARDALMISLSEFGRVDMAHMGALYGKPETEIVAELGNDIFRTPDGAYETADGYLSGNVKKKLAQAERARETDPAFERNVAALKDVIPADIDAADILVRPGAAWLPPAVLTDFATMILDAGAPVNMVYLPHTAKWRIDSRRAVSWSELATSKFGTSHLTVAHALEAAVNGDTIRITDPETGKLDEAQSSAANEKVASIVAEWDNWVWQDDDRRALLVRLYNDTFNHTVAPRYNGSHLTLPGKVSDDIIRFRPHQMNFVWRALQSQTVLADHVVGAGKTFAAIASVMEMRRMGLARKPMVVVPNHLVSQWAADFVRLYPGAKVLAPTKEDFAKGRRQTLLARIASGDYDAVIVSHSSFGFIPVGREDTIAFIEEQIDEINESITNLRAAEGRESMSVKEAQRQIARLREKISDISTATKKDQGLLFSDLGVDAIVVDEAHEFKNLFYSTSLTRIRGLGNPGGSDKAADLYIKIRLLRKATGGRNIMFLTGTPISNTIAEMFTLMRYLDEPALKAAGLSHFDAWRRNFAEVIHETEMTVTGQFKVVSRLARFVNVPELVQRYTSFADVVNNDDIKRMLAAEGKTLPLPKVSGGKPTAVVNQPTPEQVAYIASLLERAEALKEKGGKPQKGDDNMAWITTDGRKCALDVRVVQPTAPDRPDSKINIAAKKIKDVYDRWSDKRGTQLVFIDLSTPKGAAAAAAAEMHALMQAATAGDAEAQQKLDLMSPDEFIAAQAADFSAYDDLKAKLVAAGIPEKEIAFIHDANTDIRKEELFGKVRSGRVRILFGSTAKMGAGTNVQNRLVALHHIDVPWRPSDLEQREGRIIRVGNEFYAADPENFAVEIYRYATERTFDAPSWQTIEAKARFIQSVRSGTTKERTVEDIGGEAMNAAEMKAAASGNPLILEEFQVKNSLRKLETAQRNFNQEQFRTRDRLRWMLKEKGDLLASQEEAIKASEAAAEALAAPALLIDGQKFDKPGEWGAALMAKAADAKIETVRGAKFGPFDVIINPPDDPKNNPNQRKIVVALGGKRKNEFSIYDYVEQDAVGAYQKVRNDISYLTTRPKYIVDRVAEIDRQTPAMEALLGPFPQNDVLAATKARHAEILQILRDQNKPKAAAAPAGEAAPETDPEAADDAVTAPGEAASPAGADDLVAIAPDDADLSENPAGWDAVDSAPADRLSQEQRDALSAIVRQVAGIEPTYAATITVPAGSREWGTDGIPSTAAGMHSPALDAIVLALDTATEHAAYHEAFHRLQTLFITPEERIVLDRSLNRMRAMVRSNPFRAEQAAKMSAREIEAEAFAMWAQRDAARRAASGLPTKIKALWEKIRSLVLRIRSALTGMGYTTLDDVFTRAASGEMARRPVRNQQMAPVDVSSTDQRISYSLPGKIAHPSAGDFLEAIRSKLTDLTPAMLAAVPLNYFVDLARPNMTAVADYLRTKRAMDTFRQRKHTQWDETAQRWLKYISVGFIGKDKARAAELADLMHEATIEGFDPGAPGATAETDTQAALIKAYQAMPAAGKALYREVRDSYIRQAGELDLIILANIKKAMMVAQQRAADDHAKQLRAIERAPGMDPLARAAAIETANKAYAAAAKRAMWSMNARLSMLRARFEATRVKPPYFPLKRFGRYFVSVRDLDGSIISFSRRETAGEAKRLAREMAEAFPMANIERGVLEEHARGRDQLDPAMVATVEALINDAPIDAAVRGDLMDAIWQRYLELLPDLSIRKRFIHRSGTAGYSGDALRSFADHMFHAAHQMAKVKYGIDLQESLRQAVDQARVADDRTAGMTLANELKKRHDWVMNPTGSAFAQTINSAAFMWFLGTTPAAALVNLTQTVMLGVPMLGARFGSVPKAAAALLRASKDFVAGRGDVRRARLTEEDSLAMAAFYESGLIDRTNSHDLAGIGNVGVAFSPTRNRVMAIMSFLFHRAEVFNREVTALAAFRMARDAGQRAQAAIDTAHDLTYKVHFDYTNSSRPRMMQGDLAKVALVFRNYTLNMLYRLARDVHQSFRGETAAVRREARMQFAGVIGMMALMGGVTGVAGFNLIMMAMGLAFGDDDDPFDYEMKFRQDVVDVLGPELGGVVLNGVPGHYLGIDLTSRIGMADLWLRSPSGDLEGRDEYEYWVFQMLGASVSMGGQWWSGVNLIQDGNIARGVEAIAPKWARDLMKTFRYASEGVTNIKGDQILPPEDLSTMDLAKQAAGFTPAVVAEAYRRAGALNKAETRITRERSRLIAQYALAVRMGDDDARRDAAEAIKAWNRVELHRPLAITPDTLKQSIKVRRRNEEKRQDGALIQNERLGRKLRDRLAEPIYR